MNLEFHLRLPGQCQANCLLYAFLRKVMGLKTITPRTASNMCQQPRHGEAYILHRRQADASTGHRDMDPVSTSSALTVAERKEKNILAFQVGKGLVWVSL